MKLSLDQNISYRVARKLQKIFPFTETVYSLELYEKDDFTIWAYAKTHGYTLVTFDEDFYNLAVLHNSPPQIIWLKTGNLANHGIAELLIRHEPQIKEFINEEKHRCLVIYRSGFSRF